jgi:hypothetical protein
MKVTYSQRLRVWIKPVLMVFYGHKIMHNFALLQDEIVLDGYRVLTALNYTTNLPYRMVSR